MPGFEAKIARALMGEDTRPKEPQPEEDWYQMHFLPIKARKGEIGLGVPGIIQEPWDAWKREWDSARGIGEGVTQDQQIEDALAITGLLGGSGATGVPKNALGMFGGRMAATADQAALKLAEAMDARGSATREQIYQLTGWFKGVDGKWRFEIDDSKAKLVDPFTDANNPKHMNAHIPQHVGYTHTPQALSFEDYMTHPDLERAYWPTREASPSIVYDDLQGPQARYSPQTDMITMDSGAFLRDDGGLSAALHETQHAIQQREGFSSGGSPKGVLKPAIDAERARIMAIPEDRGWGSVGVTSGDIPDEHIAHSIYRRLAGEVEARTVQKRQKMTPLERRGRPPWYDYDVPEHEQIVRALLGKP